MKQYIQHSPPHPGEMLWEFYFEPLELSIKDAAKKLGISRPNLSAIVNGRAGISAFMAMKLARAFKTTPQYWLNMQASYDLWQVIKKEKKEIQKVPVLARNLNQRKHENKPIIMIPRYVEESKELKFKGNK